MPARTISRWETTSASDGSWRRVKTKVRLHRIFGLLLELVALPIAPRASAGAVVPRPAGVALGGERQGGGDNYSSASSRALRLFLSTTPTIRSAICPPLTMMRVGMAWIPSWVATCLF